MFSIPRTPVAGTSHKRHYAETEPAASGKRTRTDPAPLPDRRTFSLLNQLTAKTVLAHTMMEWLTEADAHQLMRTGQQHRQRVVDFYDSRMNHTLYYPAGLSPWARRSKKMVVAPDSWPAEQRLYLYCYPVNRRDRYIPTDQAGLDYLAAKRIYHPLTERIRKEHGIKVAQAEELIKGKRHEIAAALSGGKLAPTKSEALKNPLFAEHVECDRLDLTEALRLADNPMNLFYCLSLLPLFRAATIQLSDVGRMSQAGLRFLHDPRLLRLFSQGGISKEQLVSLTDTQYKSLLILYRPLMKRSVLAQSVLAVTGAQLAELHKAGLIPKLAAGQITLSNALQQGAICQPVLGGSRASGKSLPVQRTDSTHPVPSPATERMLLSDVAMLVDKLPITEIIRTKCELGYTNDAWFDVFRRISFVLPDYQKIEIEDTIRSYDRDGTVLRRLKPEMDRNGRELLKLEYVFSSSSSHSPPSSRDSTVSDLSGPALSAPRHQETGEIDMPLKDVALLLTRMTKSTFLEIIKGDGLGCNADWLAKFGEVIHLMPLATITHYLDTAVDDFNGPAELFHTLEERLSSPDTRAVACAYNQFFIHLAEHLSDEDYLKLARLFLQNVAAYMVIWSYRCSCPEILDQCSEIWSLVQARCEVTGKPLAEYVELVRSVLLNEPDWQRGFKPHKNEDAQQVMTSFACLLANIGLLDDDKFLGILTNSQFAEDRNFDRWYSRAQSHFRYEAIVNYHALFSAFRNCEAGARAQRFMGMAIDKSAVGLPLES